MRIALAHMIGIALATSFLAHFIAIAILTEFYIREPSIICLYSEIGLMIAFNIFLIWSLIKSSRSR